MSAELDAVTAEYKAAVEALHAAAKVLDAVDSPLDRWDPGYKENCWAARRRAARAEVRASIRTRRTTAQRSMCGWTAAEREALDAAYAEIDRRHELEVAPLREATGQAEREVTRLAYKALGLPEMAEARKHLSP